jgi:hypothetical protein
MRKRSGILLVAFLLTLSLGLALVCVLHEEHDGATASCSYCLTAGHGAPLPDLTTVVGDPHPPVEIILPSTEAVPEMFTGSTWSRAPPFSLPI